MYTCLISTIEQIFFYLDSGAVVGISADSWSNGGSSIYIFGGKPKIDLCNIGNKMGRFSFNTNQWVNYLLAVEDSGNSSDPVKIFVNGQSRFTDKLVWIRWTSFQVKDWSCTSSWELLFRHYR